jgi:hypothetical protein
MTPIPGAQRRNTMRFVALIFSNPGAFEALSDDERAAFMSGADAFHEQFGKSGQVLGGSALADPSAAKTVRARDGETAVTDGPFAEAKEQLAGYYIIECDSIERAAEIAGHDPAARVWGVEVREIVDTSGSGM